jgi:hypothetical protein
VQVNGALICRKPWVRVGVDGGLSLARHVAPASLLPPLISGLLGAEARARLLAGGWVGRALLAQTGVNLLGRGTGDRLR